MKREDKSGSVGWNRNPSGTNHQQCYSEHWFMRAFTSPMLLNTNWGLLSLKHMKTTHASLVAAGRPVDDCRWGAAWCSSLRKERTLEELLSSILTLMLLVTFFICEIKDMWRSKVTPRVLTDKLETKEMILKSRCGVQDQTQQRRRSLEVIQDILSDSPEVWLTVSSGFIDEHTCHQQVFASLMLLVLSSFLMYLSVQQHPLWYNQTHVQCLQWKCDSSFLLLSFF